MKIMVYFVVLVVLAVLAIADETDPEDLGVITAKLGLHLESQTSRPDIRHYELEFLPSTPPTNHIKLIFTNALITLKDLAALPSGRILLGLKSVCLDGTESAVKLYTLDIRRVAPPSPSARVVHIGGSEAVPEKDSLPKAVERLRSSSVLRSTLPPLPPQGDQLPPPPLPGGTNSAYAEHLDRMADFYSKTRRRNE